MRTATAVKYAQIKNELHQKANQLIVELKHINNQLDKAVEDEEFEPLHDQWDFVYAEHKAVEGKIEEIRQKLYKAIKEQPNGEAIRSAVRFYEMSLIDPNAKTLFKKNGEYFFQ